MARIRSIKPEFFTSEVVGSLPVTARLTFIGLWTHVDDNGVCLDNDRLITFAIWPHEPDLLEALARTREDLWKLHEHGLIVRYTRGDRQYLFIRSWDDHQKVSHPAKPRYPRPGEEGCTILTCEDTDPRVALGSASGDAPEDRLRTPESLRPEQGAGNREQGHIPPPEEGVASATDLFGAAPKPKESPPPKVGSDDDPMWVAFWAEFPRKEGKADARRAYTNAIIKKKTDPTILIEGARRYAGRMRHERTDPSKVKMAQGWITGERWNDEPATAPAGADPAGWWDN